MNENCIGILINSCAKITKNKKGAKNKLTTGTTVE